ncbi:MobV family relaxase [Cardinium endosymbiont of Sogatella furcifera]|uniref:MobV family relaxase n=1 Tax=Cardinium endosymbiont of Sogatella furcifera TaxID=650378 RepID=UPI0013B3AFB1|nr:MobV family relaxase [Cardinium endosymbiont of Sogatella furcifera]
MQQYTIQPIQYAVLHITKYKETGRIGTHLDRKNLTQNVAHFKSDIDPAMRELLGPHIDHTRTHLNEELSPLKNESLTKDIHSRIQSGYRGNKEIRKDAVKALGIILTGSHERMKAIEQDEKLFNDWKRANYGFACREFGSENIIRFTLHRDEKTPHIHCVVVPICKDGRLSAKSFMSGSHMLMAYQDRYANAMNRFGLNRGIAKHLTERSHIPIGQFRKETLKKKQEIMLSVTSDIPRPNLLNFKQVHQNIANQLCAYAYEAEKQKLKALETEKTYSNIIKENIRSDLDRVKREVNLIQHAASMGYQLNKAKSSRLWAVMDKDGDKILIRNGLNNNGYWTYTSLVDDKDKGTIIDFMLKRGFSYKEIRGLNSIHLDDTVIKNQSSLENDLKNLSVQEKLAKAYFCSIVYKKEDNYLTSRGIAPSTYGPYIGISLQVGRKAVFGLYQGLNNQGNGTMCSTISYQFFTDNTGKIESRKYFQKGLSRGLAVLKHPNFPVKKIVFTESPIDALSHKQLYAEKDSTMYIATCGTMSNSIIKEINNLLKEAKQHSQEVVLAFDIDQAGQRMQKLIENISKQEGIQPTKMSVTSGKDWNEQLQQNLTGQAMNFLLQLQKSIARDIRSNCSIDEYQKSRKKEIAYIDKYVGIEL